MSDVKSKVSFVLSGLLYLLFNLRLGSGLAESVQETAWQIVQTAPYVAGVTYLIIALLQYMSDGDKVPWDRRLRLFFALGILAGLLYGIYEYAGVPATGGQ